MADQWECYDSVITNEWEIYPPVAYDIIDYLADNETGMPTNCPLCGRWLTGPDSQKAGACWRCRLKWS